MTETTKISYPVLDGLTTKSKIIDVSKKLGDMLTTENLKSIKGIFKAFKSIKLILKAGPIKEDVDLEDIVCQNYEEWECLHEYRSKLATYNRKASKEVMKKLFRN
jgi:hypothetical protein